MSMGANMDIKEALMWAEKAKTGLLDVEDYDKSFEVACTLSDFIIRSLGDKFAEETK